MSSRTRTFLVHYKSRQEGSCYSCSKPWRTCCYRSARRWRTRWNRCTEHCIDFRCTCGRSGIDWWRCKRTECGRSPVRASDCLRTRLGSGRRSADCQVYIKRLVRKRSSRKGFGSCCCNRPRSTRNPCCCGSQWCIFPACRPGLQDTGCGWST